MPESEKILTAIRTVSDVTGTALSADAQEFMARDLAGEPLPDVLAALQRCARECRRLTLADIRERLPNRPPTADEAWEIALAARIWDDEITVICPAAALAAFPRSIWLAGDEVGARVAFRAAWPDALRRHGMTIQISDGWDPAGRRAAIEDAARRGLIPARRAARLLSAPEDARPDGRTGRPGLSAEQLRLVAEQARRAGSHGRALRFERRARTASGGP